MLRGIENKNIYKDVNWEEDKKKIINTKVILFVKKKKDGGVFPKFIIGTRKGYSLF